MTTAEQRMRADAAADAALVGLPSLLPWDSPSARAEVRMVDGERTRCWLRIWRRPKGGRWTAASWRWVEVDDL